ncbi:hypothetical protein AB0K11_13485 [Mycobacterium sp. NPDC050551]|uniref:hypothetical protein n=1 Tax=Mycobacterium sp. NPDC050551 TaxID=3155407 RepID=UPI00342823B4
MRLRRVSAIVSIILIAKVVLIGWVAWGRAAMIGRTPEFGAGAMLVAGLIAASLAALVIAALRVRASAARGTRR